MIKPDRRTLMRGMGAAAMAAALPASIRKALAIEPNSVTGTIQDVKHIVILMQENRSFDHYFGTLRGVRGFSDPRAVTLSTGNSVFYQPSGISYELPFHPTAPYLGYQFLGDLAHSWVDAHEAWNNGANDKWVAAKGVETMAYMDRTDLPFHYALADAFTVCDDYHCSIMSATDPNRYFLWTGWVGQNGTAPGGINVANTGSTPGTVVLNNSGASAGNGTPPYGPVVNNDEQGYNWTTYPERLQAAGVTWRVYQDMGAATLSAANEWGYTANPYIGNYGDNSLLYFLQYQNAASGSALYNASRLGTNLYNGGAYNGGSFFAQLQSDVTNNTLPQVSWIVAPQAYCEHPAYPPNWGAAYVSDVLAALTSNPEVWASTVLIINFDENDGFFDHLVAPTPPQTAANGLSTVSTVNEIYPGTTSSSYAAGPYGMGARVPMLVVSPWSKGGWVCSQTFDHTSVIRFIEQRFGVIEPNITPWRRAVSGDLTSAFNFAVANDTGARLPATTGYLAYPSSTVAGAMLEPLTQAIIASGKQPASTYKATPPTVQAMPVQESGQRLSRALPYQLQADAQPNLPGGNIAIDFGNAGTVGAFFHVRAAIAGVNAGGGTGPWGYTLDPNAASLTDVWRPSSGSAYDLSVYGPQGFYRRFAGSLAENATTLTVACVYDTTNGGITVTVTNAGTTAAIVTVQDVYTGTEKQKTVAAGADYPTTWSLAASYSWYDFLITASTDATFVRHYAGRVETGSDGVSDPHIGAGS